MNLKEFYIDEVDIEPRKKWLNEKVYYKTDVDLAVAELKKRVDELIKREETCCKTDTCLEQISDHNIAIEAYERCLKETKKVFLK